MIRTSVLSISHWRFAVLIAAAIAICPLGQAQENSAAESAASSADAAPVQAKKKEDLTANLKQIAEYQAALNEMTAMRAQAEGTRQEILDARISRTLDQLITLAHTTAKTRIADRSDGRDTGTSDREITRIIATLPDFIGKQLAYIQRGLELPRAKQTAIEQAALIADLEVSARAHDKLIDALIENNAIASEIGVDARAAEASVNKQIVRGAENASAYLDVTMDQLAKLRSQLATLPKNEELIAKIAVTEKHMLAIAEILRKRAKRMEALRLDTSSINAQLIAATGAITTEIFDLNVVTGIASDFFDGITGWVSDNGARITFQFLIFLIILAITWKVAALGEMVTNRALGSMKVSLTLLLQRMIVSTTRSVILLLGLLIRLSQLGITLGPLVIVRAGLGDSTTLLRHEQVHVRQWRRYGVLGFTARYVGWYLLWRFRRKGHLGAYLRIPMEIEASWVARRSVATAVTDELSSEVSTS